MSDARDHGVPHDVMAAESAVTSSFFMALASRKPQFARSGSPPADAA